jgi:hypothetical protein
LLKIVVSDGRLWASAWRRAWSAVEVNIPFPLGSASVSPTEQPNGQSFWSNCNYRAKMKSPVHFDEIIRKLLEGKEFHPCPFYQPGRRFSGSELSLNRSLPKMTSAVSGPPGPVPLKSAQVYPTNLGEGQALESET